RPTKQVAVFTVTLIGRAYVPGARLTRHCRNCGQAAARERIPPLLPRAGVFHYCSLQLKNCPARRAKTPGNRHSCPPLRLKTVILSSSADGFKKGPRVQFGTLQYCDQTRTRTRLFTRHA